MNLSFWSCGGLKPEPYPPPPPLVNTPKYMNNSSLSIRHWILSHVFRNFPPQSYNPWYYIRVWYKFLCYVLHDKRVLACISQRFHPCTRSPVSPCQMDREVSVVQYHMAGTRFHERPQIFDVENLYKK